MRIIKYIIYKCFSYYFKQKKEKCFFVINIQLIKLFIYLLKIKNNYYQYIFIIILQLLF